MIIHPKAVIESRILTLCDIVNQHAEPMGYRWQLVSKGAQARKLGIHNETLRWINDGIVWHNGAKYYQDRFTWGPDAVGTRVMVQAHGLAIDPDDQRLPMTSLVRK